MCCPFCKISKLRETDYIFLGCLVSAFTIFVQLMFTLSQSTMYHRDKEFNFPGKYHFLVKTTTDSVRLGVVYWNLVLSTARGVTFCEIYLQSAAHITTIHELFIHFIFKFFWPILDGRSPILDPPSSILQPLSSILDHRSWFYSTFRSFAH